MSNQVKDMTWREVQERLREFPVEIGRASCRERV